MKLTQAQIDRVKSLENTLGQLTAQQVLNDARAEDSPLHGLFDWDQAKAAEKHWLDCAREIIGAVKIVVTTETMTYKAPNYVRDTSADGQGYRSVLSLRTDPAQARESLLYTLSVVSGHLTRAYDIAAAVGLSDELDLLVQKIVGLKRGLEEAA